MACANSNRVRSRVLGCFTSLAVLGTLVFGAPTPSALAVSAHSSATTAIKTNWTTFFKGTTPAAKKEALLQNGKEFATFLLAQSKTQAARATTVKVTKVEVLSKTLAHVVYTIYLGGSPAESNAIGVALLQDKVWKVSDASFCALVSLEGSAPKACSKF